MVARRFVSVGLAGVIATAGLIAVPAGNASAAKSTYKACANKKTGEMRLVLKGKKCKKSEKKLKWNVKGPAGGQGATGPQGPQGPAGARGPAGAFEAVDQTGKVIGTFVGILSAYPMVRLPSGAILLWSNNPADPNALAVGPPQVFFRQAGCTGDAHGLQTSLPFDLGIIIGTPAAPGSAVYRMEPGTPQSFTALSTLTPTGCQAISTPVTNAFVAKPAGTVPVVAQPLRVNPVS
ncbi:MAG: hypothetical protein IPG68_04200 [Micrococcales bacterium]|nr:hypothetical protein [Micrococcales bacterium]